MKKPTWKQDLIDFVNSVASADLDYGTHDCALFVAGAVDVQTGSNFLAEWVGKYSSRTEGLIQLRRLGFDDHIAIIASELPEIPVAFGQEGDIAAIGDALGIVHGAGVYVLRQPSGIGTVPLTDATRMFRVG